ncbi:recombinase family protein [Streptomyces sp. OE57]|uniref:recombinase family protein n=1 Tax=Streptomyces lacaronensis TaxID=3379885 RepID=UPI0039B74630
MKRLSRDIAELTALADHLTAHGLVLEMLAGPLPGIYDPTGPGKLLFAFFAAMAETERANIHESTLEGLDTAARKGKHGGRPPVITMRSTPCCGAERAASPSSRTSPT